MGAELYARQFVLRQGLPDLEFLDAYHFENLEQVTDMAWVWMMDYNDERPHESLGKLAPAMFRQQLENSNLEVSQ